MIRTRSIITIVYRCSNLAMSTFFHYLSFGPLFDSNQILPLNILLFERKISRVILWRLYSSMVYYYVLQYTF